MASLRPERLAALLRVLGRGAAAVEPVLDPLLHVCIVTYASDYTLLGSSLVPHGVSYWRDDVMMASLDHAMWFHRPFRADEWLLYSQTSPSASGARGLAYGGIFRQDGTLAVSVVQEGLIRPIVDPAKLSRMYKS